MGNYSELRDMIADSKNIVFFGGAGVSTESGIPDFRSENGVFDAIRSFGYSPEELLSHRFFIEKPELFFKYYRKTLAKTGFLPNEAHRALARLEKAGKLKTVITQNVDNLHQLAGSKNVLELHGSVYRNTCMRCGKSYGIDAVNATDGVPKCECGGIIKPDVVLYGEPLDWDTVTASVEEIQAADMMIVGGTSLSVYPAASLIEYYRGRKLVLINKSSTAYDGRADIIINDAIGKVLGEAID